MGRPTPWPELPPSTGRLAGMDYGIAIFLTDETIGPAHLARLVEERGFSSLWVPEHTHIPAGRGTGAAGAARSCRGTTGAASIRSWR